MYSSPSLASRPQEMYSSPTLASRPLEVIQCMQGGGYVGTTTIASPYTGYIGANSIPVPYAETIVVDPMRAVSQPRYSVAARPEPREIYAEPRVRIMSGDQTDDVRQLAAALAQERQMRQTLESKVQGILNTLAVYKARLDRIDPPDTPLKQAARIVEQRGNVQVDHENGYVRLMRPLRFEPRTTKDRPSAVFLDIDEAEAVCKDLSELSNIFQCPMTIEGHTKGGESQFWQNLSDNRANIVTQLMIDFGADANLLRAQGKPGRLGKNEVRTDVYMDIRNIKDENSAVQEIDVVCNGRVVERDLYQAGHLVERDQNRTSILERDVIKSDGRILEKDYTVRNAQERTFVGMGGKTVERQRSDSSLLVGRPISPVAVTRPLVRQASGVARPLVEYDMVLR